MSGIAGEKNVLRQQMKSRRDGLSGRAQLSRIIADRIQSQLDSAVLPCVYVSFRSEVETAPLIQSRLDAGKPVCVPWCDGPEQLRISRIESLQELAMGTLGLQEPDRGIRNDPARHVAPDGPDLFLVPGLAFTRSGDRLGYGRGYYDRMLSLRNPGARTVGLAFHCQLLSGLPVSGDDVAVDQVITDQVITDRGGFC